jgi:hypothetical protein
MANRWCSPITLGFRRQPSAAALWFLPAFLCGSCLLADPFAGRQRLVGELMSKSQESARDLCLSENGHDPCCDPVPLFEAACRGPAFTGSKISAELRCRNVARTLVGPVPTKSKSFAGSMVRFDASSSRSLTGNSKTTETHH